MLPGGWGGGETGGFFHTPYPCEGIWCLGLFASWPCRLSDASALTGADSPARGASAALGNVSFAHRLVIQGRLSLQHALYGTEQVSTLQGLFSQGWHQELGRQEVPEGEGSSQGRSAVGWAGSGL